MTNTQSANKSERRRHPRFPVAHNLAQIVSLDIKSQSATPQNQKPQSQHTVAANAVIADLSAGGVAILTPADLSVGAEFEIIISLPSLKTKPIKCRVVRSVRKYDLNKIGIEFTHISADDRAHINAIAEDYLNCEIKLTLGVRDVCFSGCHYFHLCSKDVKIHNHK